MRSQGGGERGHDLGLRAAQRLGGGERAAGGLRRAGAQAEPGHRLLDRRVPVGVTRLAGAAQLVAHLAARAVRAVEHLTVDDDADAEAGAEVDVEPGAAAAQRAVPGLGQRARP